MWSPASSVPPWPRRPVLVGQLAGNSLWSLTTPMDTFTDEKEEELLRQINVFPSSKQHVVVDRRNIPDLMNDQLTS